MYNPQIINIINAGNRGINALVIDETLLADGLLLPEIGEAPHCILPKVTFFVTESIPPLSSVTVRVTEYVPSAK